MVRFHPVVTVNRSNMSRIYPHIVIILLFSFTSSLSLWSEDWPQWRGPHRDGVLRDAEIRESLPTGELDRLWTVKIGPGYSAPSVAKGRVYLTDRGPHGAAEQIERVFCFDAKTGSEIWSHSYPAPYSIGYRAGPRSAVTVHEGNAIAVGAMGHMKCFDAVTGDIRWQHDLLDEYQIEMPVWGITASPLVVGDRVIQIVAGSDGACVVAFDLGTGEERWKALDERAGYSSPILIQQGGQDVVVCWTGESVSGLNPRDGQLLWQIPMLPSRMPIGVPTPIVKDNLLFVSSFYDGSLMIEFDRERPAARQVWRRVGIDEKNTDALHCMIGTPIFKGKHIYGVDSYGELRCLDMKNGDRIWEDQTAVPRARWATIHMIQHGNREIMLNDQGYLIIADLNPKGYKELSRCKLIAPTKIQLPRRDGVVWAHPAIANGHIFARSDNELVCASLRPRQN